MWERFKRAMRSLLGWSISGMEDPEKVLEQNIRDMNDQVPKMNEGIAMVRANVTLLEKENTKYKTERGELASRIKAAINANREDIAGTYALQLQQMSGALARNEAQLSSGRSALEKAMKVKEAFLREKERKTQEAMHVIREAQRAKWQAKVADTLETFGVAGIDQTHDEMVRKLEERTALDEAKLEMALISPETHNLEIEKEAEKLHATELVRQFKIDMGMAEPALNEQRLGGATHASALPEGREGSGVPSGAGVKGTAKR